MKYLPVAQSLAFTVLAVVLILGLLGVIDLHPL